MKKTFYMNLSRYIEKVILFFILQGRTNEGD